MLAWLLLHQPQLYTAGFSVVIAAVGGRRWHSQAHVSGRCALCSISTLPWCHCSDGWACHRTSRRSPIAFSSSSGNFTDKSALTMQVSPFRYPRCLRSSSHRGIGYRYHCRNTRNARIYLSGHVEAVCPSTTPVLLPKPVYFTYKSMSQTSQHCIFNGASRCKKEAQVCFRDTYAMV